MRMAENWTRCFVLDSLVKAIDPDPKIKKFFFSPLFFFAHHRSPHAYFTAASTEFSHQLSLPLALLPKPSNILILFQDHFRSKSCESIS